MADATEASEPPAKRAKATGEDGKSDDTAVTTEPSATSADGGDAKETAASTPAVAAPAEGDGATAKGEAARAGDAAADEKSSDDAANEHPVINWQNAMEQCGDDEDFLRELLGDLKDEVEENISKVLQALENKTKDWPDVVRRAAHAVKGAAANLMCEQIHQAALNLETKARNSAEGSEDHRVAIQKLAEELGAAHKRFVAFTETM